MDDSPTRLFYNAAGDVVTLRIERGGRQVAAFALASREELYHLQAAILRAADMATRGDVAGSVML